MKTPKNNPRAIRMLAEAEPWLEWLAAQGKSPCTLMDYRFVLRRFANFLLDDRGLKVLRDVQQSDLEAWLRLHIKAKYSPVTVVCYLTPLLGLFRWLEERGEMFLNPGRNLEVPKSPRRLMSVPSEIQMLRLVNGVTGSSPLELRDRAILEVAYASGFRCRELIALDLDNVDLTQGVIQVVGKGSKERQGLLTQAASEALRRYLSDGRPALCIDGQSDRALWLGTRSGRRITNPALRAAVTLRSEAVGPRITPHDIRRAFATHLLRNGASPLELRRLLGHVSYRSLKHYLRYAPEELIAAHRNSVLGQ